MASGGRDIDQDCGDDQTLHRGGPLPISDPITGLGFPAFRMVLVGWRAGSDGLAAVADPSQLMACLAYPRQAIICFSSGFGNFCWKKSNAD